MTYTPRRQSARWLDGDCPPGVLAIYDAGPSVLDRYTVFYRPPVPLADRGDRIEYLAASAHPFGPQGVGQHADLPAYIVAEYRYRVAHRACRWSDLPPDVQRCVRADLTLPETGD